jgi:hypothetical protein
MHRTGMGNYFLFRGRMLEIQIDQSLMSLRRKIIYG